MKKMMTVGLAMAFFCNNSLAQNLPMPMPMPVHVPVPLPMLMSKDALRTYAVEQVAKASGSIGSQLPLGNNAYKFEIILRPGVSGIIETIRNMKLSVDVVNPKDYLYAWSGAFSSEGDLLFYGQNQFKLVPAKGGWKLPASYGDMSLELADEIPLWIDGAMDAQITFLLEDGESERSTSLRVNDGKVYFPKGLAGTSSILSVLTRGDSDMSGDWRHWNVQNGTVINPEHFALTIAPSIKGILTFTDKNVMVNVPTVNGEGENITAELKVSSERTLLVSYFTSESKWFIGAWVRMSGTDTWQYYAAQQLKGGTLTGMFIDFKSGTYYIIPAWNDGDLIEPTTPWNPPYMDGKG